jgi:hypothetical protein
MVSSSQAAAMDAAWPKSLNFSKGHLGSIQEFAAGAERDFSS